MGNETFYLDGLDIVIFERNVWECHLVSNISNGVTVLLGYLATVLLYNGLLFSDGLYIARVDCI